MTLVDELTETRGHGNRVCVGQGVANTLTGLFGGMGGCAMVGQTLIDEGAVCEVPLQPGQPGNGPAVALRRIAANV